MTYGFVVNHPIRTAKIDIPNNFGLTPIALACVLGKSKIFREIIELSCKVNINDFKIINLIIN